MQDTLFLLKPGFRDQGAHFFCASCATVEGMLSFFPEFRKLVDVRYIDYPRPRNEIVDEIGEEYQGAPCLIVRSDERVQMAPPGVHFERALGKAFLNDPIEICLYLARVYGADAPH